MAIHDDIAESVPDPPPPAPARRAAAIEQALQRFDGGGAAAPVTARPSRAARWSPSWSPTGRRYAGAIASLALVVLIGVPVARDSMREPTVAEQGERRAAIASKTVPSPPTIAADASGEPTASSRGPALSDIQAESRSQADAVDTASGPDPVALAEATPPSAMERAAGPSGRSPSEEGDASRDAEIVVSGSRVAAPAMTPPAEGLATERENSVIVTTGSRVRVPRGDWNECTVDDPVRSLAGCRHLVDPAAKTATGRAAAHLADGLTLAWKGELDSAIAAFDRAIEIAPRASFAYLNRGMAYRRNGDPDRALADLDRAVRNAPRSARAYYHRSLVLRQEGASARAQADEERAVALDPRYSAVVN